MNQPSENTKSNFPEADNDNSTARGEKMLPRDLYKKSGGARVGAGRKKKDVENIMISAEKENLRIIKEAIRLGLVKNRSEAFNQGIAKLRSDHPEWDKIK